MKGCCSGTVKVYLKDENTDAAAAGTLQLSDDQQWTEVSFDLKGAAGEHPLRFVYSGEGVWELAEVNIG